MKRFVAALAILAMLANVATADCGRVRCVNRAVVAEVVTPVVATVATFVPVTVAAYSASYQPNDNAVLTELLRQIDGRLSRLESGGVVVNATPNAKGLAAPQMPRADIDPGLAVFQNRCAGCHDAAKAKGGMPAFQKDGVLANLDCATAADCLAAVTLTEMPKGGQLQEQELIDLVKWLRVVAKRQQAKK